MSTQVAAKTVLVVEDDRANLLVVKGYLEGAGYRVATAASGEEGLARARAGGIDLITLDILMEPLDGWAVFRTLREDPATRDIPIVFVTIVDAPERGPELGAAGYLVKPFRGRALLDVVARALGDAEG